jgi:hypothetical protein
MFTIPRTRPPAAHPDDRRGKTIAADVIEQDRIALRHDHMM